MSSPSSFLLAYRNLSSLPTFATRVTLLAALLCAPFASPLRAAEHPVLHVAAASDLQAIMPVLAQTYERATGQKMVVIYSTSSALVTQIRHGAPIDLFLGADFFSPEEIVAANLADARAPTSYGKGTLVLWARKDSPLQPLSIDSLTDKRVSRIALPDPIRALYGRSAVAAFERMKIYDQLKPHLVAAEDISQAAHLTETGDTQLGLLSLTLASSERMKQLGTYVPMPKVYPEITQSAVVLKRSPRRAEAHAFLDWLTSEPIQQQLKNIGLDPVH